MTLELYYDIVCPYARLGYYRVRELAAEAGVAVTLRPILLGGLFSAHAAPQVPARAWGPARLRYSLQDILWCSARDGRPVEVPLAHPRRSVEAMRLVTAAPPALQGPVSEALFEAYWVEGRDVADRAVLAEIAGRFGLSIDSIDDPAVKQALRAQTAAAAERGIFGVPTVFRGEKMYWGRDRLHFLSADLGLARPAPTPQPSEGPPLRFFHDFASPFSYLGATQIEALAARFGRRVEWRPILLGALFREIGTADVPLFTFSAARQAWFLRDLEEWAAHWGVPFAFPAQFPVRTVLPLRVSILCPAATLPLYRAFWAQGRDIADPAVVAAILAEEGLDPALVGRAEEAREILKANTAMAIEAGVFGVPTTAVEGAGLLWGQDRLGMVEDLLGGWVPPTVL